MMDITGRTPRLASLAIIFAATSVCSSSAQNCYYPNGDVSKTDASCSSEGGACCPLNWECMSNGLCYYDPENYFGRYTCTDESWGESCPNYCTADGTAPGNEAIQQCDDGSWCCDGDRSFDCCTTKGSEKIDVPDGEIVASISKIEAPTSVQTSSSRTTSTLDPTDTFGVATTTLPSSSSTTSNAAASSNTDSTSTTPTHPPESSSSSDIIIPDTPPPSPPASSNTLTIGLGVGIPVGLILASILAFLLYRHRKNSPFHQATNPSDKDGMPYMYDKPKNAAEIDSYPIAVDNNTPSGSKRISELSGSNHFLPPNTGSPVSQLPSPTSSQHGSGFNGTFLSSTSPALPLVSEEEGEQEAHELPPEGNPARTTTLRLTNPDPVSPPYPLDPRALRDMGEAYRWSSGLPPVLQYGWASPQGEKEKERDEGKGAKGEVNGDGDSGKGGVEVAIGTEGSQIEGQGLGEGDGYQAYDRKMGVLAVPEQGAGIKKIRPISPIVQGALGSRRDELDT